MKKFSENSLKTGPKFGQILGINVISTCINEVLAEVNDFITHNVKFFVVTPNPEIIILAQENPDLKRALNEADFPVPDGVGLAYASRFLYGKGLTIIPGRKLFDELIKLATKKHWKVFLLGGLDNEAHLASQQLSNIDNQLSIEAYQGPRLDNNANPATENDKKLEKDSINRINEFAPDLLFVAMKNPKQEIWIHKNLSKLNIGGAMAVGGTFRYVAGLSKLPPKWMEKAGLEWLWRLLTEPNRIGRIWNAVIVFPWKVFVYKISGE